MCVLTSGCDVKLCFSFLLLFFILLVFICYLYQCILYAAVIFLTTINNNNNNRGNSHTRVLANTPQHVQAERYVDLLGGV
jgi:hypothetical protein